MHQLSQFSFPTDITFGVGAIDTLAAHLQENNVQRPLLVTDPMLATMPIIENCIAQLSNAQLNTTCFSEISKNPVKSNVTLGESVYKENNCDAIIGFGGGASIDVARAIALKINHTQDLFDYEDSIDGWKLITNDIPYFVTIPTTSGTGSEVGRSAVISDDDTHQKKILFSPKLLAKHVFADPALTLELPAHITAAVGIDALTHNIEAYVSKGFHPLCDGIATEAILLIMSSLEKAVHQPTDIAARSDMMAAALMGAVAFQKGLGVVHSCAHALSTHADLHHGLANALMLVECMKFNSSIAHEHYAQLSHSLRQINPSSKTFIGSIENLIHSINIQTGLSQHSIEESDISTLAKLALDDVCHQCNPKNVSLNDFENIYRAAL